MILVKPSHEIIAMLGYDKKYELLPCDTPLGLIELAGRTCYKTEEKITPTSAIKFVEDRLKQGHESIIEHSAITVKITCDRGVTHEIVRHRLVAYSQESTRYCNYKGGVTFVIPPWVDFVPGEYSGLVDSEDIIHCCNPGTEDLWYDAMLCAEKTYIGLLDKGWSPGQARSVLPNSLKTEIVMTANIREWRHILKLRTSKAAHIQMHEVMVPILEEFKHKIPILFDDIKEGE